MKTDQVVESNNEGLKTFKNIITKDIVSNKWSGVSFLCMTCVPFSYVLARITQIKLSCRPKPKTNQLVGIQVG